MRQRRLVHRPVSVRPMSRERRYRLMTRAVPLLCNLAATTALVTVLIAR